MHVIEPAPTGRATCRGCGLKIPGKDLRLGERAPNTYADDGSETTYWYHLACGAFRRPEPFLEALASTAAVVADRVRLEHEARLGVAHHRLPRANVAECAPSGRATCRSCRTPIEKGAWRISLVFYEDGRFNPAGFVHLTCVDGYFETRAILERVRHFSAELTPAEWSSFEQALAAVPLAPSTTSDAST
jgi:hypothetical protein